MYFVLADKNEEALDYFHWYESEFPDDCGEPLAFLMWALAEYRGGHPGPATARLAQAMLGNLRFVPHFLGRPVGQGESGVFSSRPYLDDPDYMDEYRPAFSPAELQWIASTYDGSPMAALRKAYVTYAQKLKSLPVGPERTAFVHQWPTEENEAIQRMMALDK